MHSLFPRKLEVVARVEFSAWRKCPPLEVLRKPGFGWTFARPEFLYPTDLDYEEVSPKIEMVEGNLIPLMNLDHSIQIRMRARGIIRYEIQRREYVDYEVADVDGETICGFKILWKL